jgi:hypothetical protein
MTDNSEDPSNLTSLSGNDLEPGNVIADRRDEVGNRPGGPPIVNDPDINPGDLESIRRDINTVIIDYDKDSRIEFKDGFEDPDVSIEHSRETTDNTVVSGHASNFTNMNRNVEYLVQALGRKPPKIKLSGWITSSQVVNADVIVSSNTVAIISSRYVGYAVPTAVDIPYSRVYNKDHGWIFNVDMTFRASEWAASPISNGVSNLGEFLSRDEPTSASDTEEDIRDLTQQITEEFSLIPSVPGESREEQLQRQFEQEYLDARLASGESIQSIVDYLLNDERPEQFMDSPPSHASGDTGKHGEITARISGIELKPEFSDPDVNITHERETAEHSVVPGHEKYVDNGVDFIIQALGRNPPEISISMWVTQEQLSSVENIIALDRIFIETARYVGECVPRSMNVDDNRVYHEKYGWIYNVDMELFGTQPSDAVYFDLYTQQ